MNLSFDYFWVYFKANIGGQYWNSQSGVGFLSSHSLVLLDVFDSVFQVSKSLWGIISVDTNSYISKIHVGDETMYWTLKQHHLPAELLDEVGSVLGDLLGELDHVDASQDDVVGLHWIWTWKWRTGDRNEHCRTLTKFDQFDSAVLPLLVSSPARQQLVHQDSQRPVVCWDIVALVEDDLWSDILWRSTERPRLLTDTNLLGETKVNLEQTELTELMVKGWTHFSSRATIATKPPLLSATGRVVLNLSTFMISSGLLWIN